MVQCLVQKKDQLITMERLKVEWMAQCLLLENSWGSHLAKLIMLAAYLVSRMVQSMLKEVCLVLLLVSDLCLVLCLEMMQDQWILMAK